MGVVFGPDRWLSLCLHFGDLEKDRQTCEYNERHISVIVIASLTMRDLM